MVEEVGAERSSAIDESKLTDVNEGVSHQSNSVSSRANDLIRQAEEEAKATAKD